MTNDELNEIVFEKASQEQRKFRERLLSCEPAEILRSAYEYSIREDIVILFQECITLNDKQCRALIETDDIIGKVFRKFNQIESSYMETLSDTIRNTANQLVRGS